jgi:hypothetical protein
MKSETSGLFQASVLEKPVISIVFSFHSLTLPWTSIPKIGALAVSTSWRSSVALEMKEEKDHNK